MRASSRLSAVRDAMQEAGGAATAQGLLVPRAEISAPDLALLDRDGCLPLGPLLTPAGVRHCVGQVEALVAQLPPGVEPSLVSMHLRPGGEWLLELARQLVPMLRPFVGDEAVILNSHIIAKPPLGGQPVQWHQDAPYWNVRPTETLAPTVWIALDGAPLLPPSPRSVAPPRSVA